MIVGLGADAGEAARRKPTRVTPPDLKILAVTMTPDPYQPGGEPLEVRIDLELPEEIAEGTLLDLSVLIASPSRTSMRFLSQRDPVESHQPIESAERAAIGGKTKPRISVTLTWDGTDQSRQVVAAGRFTYEIRAKLLGAGDRGPRTQMVSWPKRGTLEVVEAGR
jgi:hypothetical protein